MSQYLQASHGSFRLQWKGDVLCINIEGVTNVEAANVFFLRLQEMVAERGPQRWGRLVDLRQWEGFTPQAKEAYAAITDWYASAGAVAHVQIYPNSFFRDMASDINARVASSGPLLQCKTEEEGLEWLRTFGLRTE